MVGKVGDTEPKIGAVVTYFRGILTRQRRGGYIEEMMETYYGLYNEGWMYGR